MPQKVKRQPAISGESDRLVLVSHPLCPYVQRAAIALTEKEVPFQRRTIDLADKPDWFRAISPLGRVPLLMVGDHERPPVLFESAAILEFLEETQPHPLHPDDPIARARHRAWIEFGSTVLNGIARFYNAPDAAALDEQAKHLAELFGRLDEELGSRTAGDWFAGQGFSLVDAVFGPVFRYFDTFDRIADFGVLAQTPRVLAWRHALSTRPSIACAVAPDYSARLLAFLRARRAYLSQLIPPDLMPGAHRSLEVGPAT